MQWEMIVTLAVAAPVVLFPVAFVLDLNIGGIFTVLKAVRTRKALRTSKVTANIA